MKNIKKIFSLALVFVLIFTLLTACGQSDDENGGSEPDTSGETQANGSDSEEPGDSDDSGDSVEFDGKFIIGGFGPITGANASYGTSVKDGAEIAVEEINAAGGVQVGDQKLELVYTFEDDEASSDVAQSAYNKLMDDGAQAILGGVTSGSHLGVTDLTYEDNILMLTPSATVANAVENPNAFRLCFTDPLQGEIMADYALNTAGASKIAILYNQADEYSTGIMQVFEAKVKEAGGEIVANEAFEEGATDFKTQLTTIKGSDAELIFAPVYYQAASYMTQQAKELDMDIPFIGTDGWDGVLAVSVDPANVEGAVFLTPFVSSDTNPAVQDFVAKYEEKTGGVPDQFAAQAYDCAYVIKAALEQAASVESDALIAAMTEIEVEGLTGKVSFDETGEPHKEAKLVEIVNGEYTMQ